MNMVTLNNMRNQSYRLKESLRALRTNIQFCGDDVKVIMITSTAPNEGKSTVVMELARSLVDSRKKVLVIDSDMRKSVLVGRLRAKAMDGKINGLSHFLSGQARLEDVLYSTQLPGLYMIFAGPSVPNPTEILEKLYFPRLIELARKEFDYVLIDCAPLGSAIDAAIVARECDGAIMVVAQDEVSTKAVIEAKKQLEITGVRMLGVVLNKVKATKSHYGKYYGYGYGDYYGNYTGESQNDEEDIV